MTEPNPKSVANIGYSSSDILSMLRAGGRIEINDRPLVLCSECKADQKQIPACKVCAGRGITNADGSAWDGK